MKKLLGIVVLGLLWCNTVIAGKGSNCALEIDKATRSQEYGWIRFEVYNPTNKKIIITGVKYYKGDDFWREYSDIYETVGYKRNMEFVHSVNTTGPISYVLQCHEKKSTVYTPKKEKKSKTKKLLEKIIGN